MRPQRNSSRVMQRQVRAIRTISINEFAGADIPLVGHSWLRKALGVLSCAEGMWIILKRFEDP